MSNMLRWSETCFLKAHIITYLPSFISKLDLKDGKKFQRMNSCDENAFNYFTTQLSY